MFNIKLNKVLSTKKFLATEEECFRALAREAKSTRKDEREFVPFGPNVEATGDLYSEEFVDSLSEAIFEDIKTLNWRDQLRVDALLEVESADRGKTSVKKSFQILCEHRGKGKIKRGWDNTVISIKAL